MQQAAGMGGAPPRGWLPEGESSSNDAFPALSSGKKEPSIELLDELRDGHQQPEMLTHEERCARGSLRLCKMKGPGAEEQPTSSNAEGKGL